MLIRKLFVVILGIMIWFPGVSQQTTSGPLRPSNVSTGFVSLKSANEVVISGVPKYQWRHGCAPTAIGMVIGYYDSHGYPDLIPGDASTQSAQVQQVIASSEHYDDYSLPLDDNSEDIIPDKSDTGGAHQANCIADYLETSWSRKNNRYGWSWGASMPLAFTKYVRQRDADITVVKRYERFSVNNWNEYKNEIDNDRPVVLLIDTDGDNSTDHMATGVGYNDENQRYAVYDTWDQQIHWFEWRNMADGRDWGVYSSCFIELGYSITGSTYPGPGGTISGEGVYQRGQEVKLIATPTTYYKFLNWTESGVEVSTEQEYSFVVEGKRTLVANFASTVCEINVTVKPIDGGYVRGGGKNEVDSEITLMAMRNPGFQFINWTEDGIEVSSDSTFIFTGKENRNLVANFGIATSIDKLYNEQLVNVFPNPAREFINMDLKGYSLDNLRLKIEILNTLGTILLIKEFDFPSNQRLRIGLSEIPPGLYYLKVVPDQTESILKKVVILE